MTPAQYRTAIERLGLTQAQAAEYLGVSVRTSHGYANGAPIPFATGLLLDMLVEKAPHETVRDVLNRLSARYKTQAG